MPTPEQELDLIASTAALYKPAMLHRKIELLANALLFQHEAVINELVDQIDNAEKLAMFHSFSQDARSLELLLNILGGVEPDFVKASEASVQEVLKLSKKQISNDLLDDQKEHLENLLKDN